MANHIQNLQDKVAAAEAYNTALGGEIQDLLEYLASPKFSCGDALDGYVNVNDVVARLRMAQHVATVAEASAAPIGTRTAKIRILKEVA